jgi:hypothetical protein
MSVRNLALVVVAGGLVLGAAACGTDAVPASAPVAAATTAPAPGPSAAVPAPSPSAAAQQASCPASEADLKGAVKEKLDNGVSPASTFKRIECYQDHAIATVAGTSESDEQYAVFTATSGEWAIVAAGTAQLCGDVVPADVVKRFQDARYGACH